MQVPPEPRAPLLSSPRAWLRAAGVERWARRGAALSASLPAPSPTPQAPFPLHCSGCLFGEAPHSGTQRGVCPALAALGSPAARSHFSPATAAGCLGHELPCLWRWDDPAGDVSKTAPCGKSDCVWFWASLPWLGPSSLLCKQNRQLLLLVCPQAQRLASPPPRAQEAEHPRLPPGQTGVSSHPRP